VGPAPRRLRVAARLLFFLSAPLLGAAVVCLVAGLTAADEIAARLLARILSEVDPEALAGLPPGFLTADTVQRAAFALAGGLGLLGLGQLATAVGLGRRARWSYAAAVVGGLFVACTAGASAIFMVVATSAQAALATGLLVGGAVLGVVALLYGTVAVLTAAGRREWENPVG